MDERVLSYSLFPELRRREGFGPDCRVFVEGRGYCCVSEVAGMSVHLWNGTSFETADVIPLGRRSLLTLVLKNGLAIDCTSGQHLIIATTKNKKRPYPVDFLCEKLPGRSRNNWRVLLTDAVPDWSYPYGLPEPATPRAHNARYITLAPIKSPAELGELLGRIASDGGVQRGSSSMGGTVRLLVAEHERCLIPVLMNTLAKLGCPPSEELQKKRRKYGDEYQPVHRLIVCSTTLADQLIQLRVKRDVPTIAWMDACLLKAYLRGDFDGDGTVHPDGAVLTWGRGGFHTKWARHVQGALLLVGIRSRVRVYEGQGGSIRLQVQKRDMPLFAENVGFMNPVKQAKAAVVVGHPSKGSAAYGRAIAIWRATRYERQRQAYAIATCSGRAMVNGVVVDV